MKITAVLLCLALLVAIVHSAAVGSAKAHRALTDVESSLKQLKENHALAHDAAFRKKAAFAKRAAGKLSGKQRREAAKKVASDLHVGKSAAKKVVGMAKAKHVV